MAEFAVIAPLLMFLLLAYIALGLLFLAHHNMQAAIERLAQMAAWDVHTGVWRDAVSDESERSGCNASPVQPELEFPDGNEDPGSRLRLTWHCFLDTRWIFDGLPITVVGASVIAPTVIPLASPAPVPS